MNKIRNILAYMVIIWAILGPFTIAALAGAADQPVAVEEGQPKKAELSLWESFEEGRLCDGAVSNLLNSGLWPARLSGASP